MPYKDKEAGRARKHQYYLEHREEIAAQHAAYYQRNREARRAQLNSYSSLHREEARQRTKQWNKANPEKRRANHRQEKGIRRAKENGATIGDKAAIKAIYRQARENKTVRCYLCGKLIPIGKRHVDHVVPLSKGGKHAASNMAIAHSFCNTSKGGKMPQDVGVLL